jgi:hypothetical protein
MAALDVLPEILTAASALSSVAGVFLERIRRIRKKEETLRIEKVATDAVLEVSEKSTVSTPVIHGHSDTVVASATEIRDAVSAAVGQALTDARKEDRRYGMLVTTAFFIAGILATIVITLLVHPLK